MKINTDKDCNIIVSNNIEELRNSVVLYIAQLNESSRTTILYSKLHSEKEVTITLSPQKNGFMTFCSIILPKLPPLPDLYNQSISYYSDGEQIYKIVEGEIITVKDWQELIDLNNPPFTREIQNFFSVCFLRKCYISLCQKIFKSRGFDKCFNDKVNSQLLYKRDLVWAALNTIQYMIDSNQLAEAQRLLERIGGCNGLCTSEDTGDKGCGCDGML